MPILQYLDVAIGYAFAMLLLATLTGAAVEAIQAILRSRTFALEKGLANMIENLGLDAATAARLAKEVTKDAPVKGSLLSTDAVQREEFIVILLRKAVAAAGSADGNSVGNEDGKALREALLKLTPGKNPEQLLRDIEQNLLKMEADEPDAPSYVWRVKAMQAAGAGPLAGRVFSWYDNMTRRVDDAVNFQGRAFGLVAAGLVCFYLVPVDSLDLLRRLGRDEVFRKALVERAIEEVKKAPPAGADRAGGGERVATEGKAGGAKSTSDTTDKPAPGAAKSEPTAKDEAGAVKKSAATPLPAQTGGVPAGTGKGHQASATPAEKSASSAIQKSAHPTQIEPISAQEAQTQRVQAIVEKLQKDADQTRGLLTVSPGPVQFSAGHAVTWVMVSLGSAFWWGLLKKLVGLKSSLTEKIETQRLHRESDQRTKAT